MIIKKIEHSYGEFKLCISDLNFKKNTIIGLVGKNGAGKTTLMEILSGFRKSNIIYEVDGINVKDLLFIPSDLSVYNYLTVEEFLKFVIKYSETKKTVEQLLNILDLTAKAKVVVEELSQGMKKKLSLVPLFIKKYELIILDEPFNSIDLEYIYSLKKNIKQFKKHSTVIISSHILDTLADICDSLVLIENGKIKKHIENSQSVEKLEREIFD